jgi:glutathione S-transferase
MAETKLYVVPASHPCATVMKALELKGVPYKRVDLVPTFHVVAQRLRFGRRTVPGIVFDDGTKVQGSRAILRELEKRKPEPTLYKPGIEEAEMWGDEVLQPLVRRVLWQALTADTGAQESYLEGARLFPPTPRPVARMSGGAVAWAERKLNGSTPDAVRADLDALPAHLDRIDAWIADGTLGGETAADLQVFASVRLLMTLDDLAQEFAGRPCAEHARRLFGDYPGRVSAGALAARA